MAMKGSGGGGYHSRQQVEKSVRIGTGSKGTRPAGVAMLGTMQGDHVTTHGGSATGYRGEKLHHDRSFQPVPFGNQVALNVGPGGPGKGYTLYGQSGSQACHGKPAQGGKGLPSTKGQWPD
jgi:hypothetical protein